MSSYIKISASELKRRCRRVLNMIYEKRTLMLEREIAYLIAKSERSRIRKLLRRPVMTREQALIELQRPEDEFSCLSVYSYIQTTGGMIERRVKDLMFAAEYGGDVNVSIDDFRLLV